MGGGGGGGWQAALRHLPETVAEIIREVTDAWARSVGGTVGGSGSGGGADGGRHGAAGGAGAGGGCGGMEAGELGAEAEALLSLGSSFVQGVNGVGKVWKV